LRKRFFKTGMPFRFIFFKNSKFFHGIFLKEQGRCEIESLGQRSWIEKGLLEGSAMQTDTIRRQKNFFTCAP
jgi:hypothetical protein